MHIKIIYTTFKNIYALKGEWTKYIQLYRQIGKKKQKEKYITVFFSTEQIYLGSHDQNFKSFNSEQTSGTQ